MYTGRLERPNAFIATLVTPVFVCGRGQGDPVAAGRNGRGRAPARFADEMKVVAMGATCPVELAPVVCDGPPAFRSRDPAMGPSNTLNDIRACLRTS